MTSPGPPSTSTATPDTPPPAYAQTFSIPAQAVGPDARLQLPGLLTYLHETAQQHAQSLGYGFAELQHRGLAWALVALELQLDPLPRAGEPLAVSTSVPRAAGPLAFRDYRATTHGVPVCAGQGIWALISLETRRSATPPPDLHAALHAEARALQSEVPRARRLPVSDPLPVVAEWVVGYHDLDFNGHLNNVVAARWLLDAVYDVCAPHQRPGRLHLSYHHELLRHERASVGQASNLDGSIALELRRADGKPIATAAVTLVDV